MLGNITISPLARATAVADPQIREVRNLKSGQIIEARRFIQRVRYDRFVQVRSQIKEAMDAGRPRVACAICGTPVYLVSSPDKKFFFRHRIEDGSCPAQTRNGLSEDDIRAMKYKGAQESEAHRRVKALIERSLRADTLFEMIQVETSWRSKRDPTSLRRPDVQARFNKFRIAFEAQLSTTFLDVVIGRKSFYRAEGGLLVWVLRHFDPDYRKLTTDDILFNNNSNIITVNNSSTEASESSGRLMLQCAFRRTVLKADDLVAVWENKLVAWDDLTLDLVNQRIFAFDTEGEESRLIRERNAALADQRNSRDKDLRNQLLSVAASREEIKDWKAHSIVWNTLKLQFEEHGFSLPGDYEIDQRFRNIICGITSALEGHPIGYGFLKLIQVAHHLADHFPEALLPFGYALRISERDDVLQNEDKNGRWDRKAKIHRDAIRGDPTYRLSDELRAVLSFLFPNLSKSLNPILLSA